MYACWVTRCTFSSEGPANPSDKLPTASLPPFPEAQPLALCSSPGWQPCLGTTRHHHPTLPLHTQHTKQTNSNSQHSLQPPPPSRGRSIWLFAFHLTRASQEPHFLKKTQYSSLSPSQGSSSSLCVNAHVCVCAYICIH